ncbi:MAG: hypothetical protein JSR37_05380 [Verrucomicrobia bacterium]|nr:hypothetical protein [Verrucomicrobiota bacterium]MBS0636848.1 hypothetical protein [Verrucomicrobiota bacterium]
MKKLLLALSALLLMSAQTVEDLDKEIKMFKDARDRAAMQAYISGSNADQFLDQNWTDYQQAIRKQEMYKEQVKVLDEKIQELEAQKAALQKK